MKTELRMETSVFRPFEVVFTIESMQDLQEFKAVFGATPFKFGGTNANNVFDRINKMAKEEK